MSPIPFTQYLRPDGKKQLIFIDRPDEIATVAKHVTDKGFRFEAEVLTTGHVSLTVFDPEDEVDIAIKVVPNGPEVVEAVDELVRIAASRLG